MQLGFVIDHSSCIGCHACTVACKSENEVPLGSFRTWVKYTEQGEFPTVKRSFAVLRCNQCSKPPCVDICPTGALWKRQENGIIDIDYEACIGCKSCMQACPYDALYINESTGTAEKCHFCAHRVDQGLAPACAVVCPTEAIIPGDFDNPESFVSQMKASNPLKARKLEAGTHPNVWYNEATDPGLEPLKTNGAGGYLWSKPLDNERHQAEISQAREQSSEARTVYDVPRQLLWGSKISFYLLTKSLGAGLFVAALPQYLEFFAGSLSGWQLIWNPILALVFLAMTMGLLIADLKKPGRFWYLLVRPNWKSWLSKGGILISVYGLLLLAWIFILLKETALLFSGLNYTLMGLTLIFAGLSACYTAWLFHQAKGRPLWMKKGFAFHLLIQAFVAGTAGHLALLTFVDISETSLTFLRHGLMGGLLLHTLMISFEGHLAPAKREEEYHRAHRLITKGPFARQHWFGGLALGIVVPFILIINSSDPFVLGIAGILALIGLYCEEDVFVKAGQSLPIS